MLGLGSDDCRSSFHHYGRPPAAALPTTGECPCACCRQRSLKINAVGASEVSGKYYNMSFKASFRKLQVVSELQLCILASNTRALKQLSNLPVRMFHEGAGCGGFCPEGSTARVFMATPRSAMPRLATKQAH